MPHFALPKFHQLARVGVLKFIVAPADSEGGATPPADTQDTGAGGKAGSKSPTGNQTATTGTTTPKVDGEDQGAGKDEDAPLNAGGQKALAAERAANKELQRQIKELKAVKPADDDLAAQLAAVRGELAAQRLETERHRIAGVHKLNAEQVELLGELTDVAVMEKFAAALATTTATTEAGIGRDATTSGTGGTAGLVQRKPDLSQGQGGSKTDTADDLFEARYGHRIKK